MKGVLFYFLLFFSISSYAQSEQVLIEEATRLEASFNETAAFEKIKQVLMLNSNNYYASWKACELYCRIGYRLSTKEMQTNYYLKGKSYAENAIRIEPDGADGYYALSLAMGRLALVLPAKDKIEAVKLIKVNAEKALQLNPLHAGAWHVLGKWHFEVSNLNFFEKTGVKLMFGGLPPASIKYSIQAFENSKKIEPNLAINYLELAKAYKINDEPSKAISLLKILPTIPNRSIEDSQIKKQGNAMLKSMVN